MQDMRHMNALGTATYGASSINHKKHPDHNKQGFLVRAVKPGVYGLAMRQPGDVFQIKFARHFADHKDPDLVGLGWMERVDDKPTPRRGPPKVQAEGRGNRPPPQDPSMREQAMAQVDKMTEEAMAEDAAAAAAAREAEVI
jgi:hypothetical protein